MNPRRSTSTSITLKEFASAAGVSTAAASNALSGKGRLSDETRLRIVELARELGYKPNPTAASLRTGLTKNIGFVIYSDPDPASEQRWAGYSAHLLYTLVAEATRHGYSVSIIAADRPEQLITSRIDLLYYLDPFDDEVLIDEAVRLGIPVLSNDRFDDPRISINIDTQFEAMTRAALDLLVRHGSTKPALFTELEGIASDEGAEHVYRSWCSEKGFTPRVVRGDYGRTDLHERLAELLSTGCDGIYSFYEEGPQILEYLTSQGIRVPQDVLLIAAATDPRENSSIGVSSTVFHPEHTASAAFNSIIELSKNPDLAPLTVQLPWELVEQNSSARAN